LDIKLDNGFSINIPSDEFEKPLRGLDINGAPTVNHSLREIQVFQSPAEGNTIVLGRAFLSQVWLKTTRLEVKTKKLTKGRRPIFRWITIQALSVWHDVGTPMGICLFQSLVISNKSGYPPNKKGWWSWVLF